MPLATFSTAVIASWRWKPWNTKPIWWARSPASSASDALTASRPATVTSPLLGRSSVPRIVSIVVLPEPEGPTTATWSPAAISTLTSRSATTAPAYSLLTSFSWSALIRTARRSSLRVGYLQAGVDLRPVNLYVTSGEQTWSYGEQTVR